MINATHQRPYQRPAQAKNFTSFMDVARAPLGRTETWALPTLAKSRVLDRQWYAESDAVQSGAAEVFCSGGVFVNQNRVGVLTYDEQPGRDAVFAIEGKFWLPLAYLAATDGTVSSLSASALKGKAAYYNVVEGLFTDTAPSTDASLKVGYFDGEVSIKPIPGLSGIWFAEIYLDPSVMQTNTAVSLPADAAKSYVAAGTSNLIVSISDFVGLRQQLSLTAANTDPNRPLLPENVTWTVEGTELAEKGVDVYATFTAGSGKTISVSVVFGTDAPVTAAYTVTMSASAAPASLATA